MVSVETLGPLVPGPAAAGVDCLPANNNLDLVRWRGRLWLAWRTAPKHFASPLARLEVTSAPGPAGPWRHERTIHLGADVREPRWVALDDHLQLWFLELGTDPKRFQPRGVHRTTTDGSTWTDVEQALPAGIVPWRVRRLSGRWALFSYRGGERMYSARPADPTAELRWSDDLEHWSDPIDVLPGAIEFELIDLPDGRVAGVTRNEGPTRRGGDVLLGPDAEHLDAYPIARKLDSPHLVLWGDDPVVLARRQLAFGGRYDLVPSWTPPAVAIRVDQAVWSLTRKRSAIYRLDLDRLDVAWLADLPSRGDTAFAAIVPEPDGSLLVADYTSPAAGGDVRWLHGQLRPTEIHLHRLRRRASPLPPPAPRAAAAG